MNLTFQAQCYLAAWDAEQPVEGGLAHAARLWDFKLDYSWRSLSRIDAFLDELRARETPEFNAFLQERANVNLLYLLAFYVGEVRARRCGVAAQWMTWPELLAADPANQAFGEGFHSSAVQVQPGCFLPLVAIVTRLFEGPDEKSVAFSSMTAMEHFPDHTGGEAARILPPLPPASIVDCAGAAFTKLPALQRLRYRAPGWPAWFAGDPLDRWRRNAPALLDAGRAVWASVVQANNGLFDGSVEGAPLEVVYDPRGMVSKESLASVAVLLFSLKGTRVGDPALQVYADHLHAETTRLFNWTPPASFLPYPLTATTTYLQTDWLPGGMLAFSQFPILVSDDCPGNVLVLPRELWPAELLLQWGQVPEAPAAGTKPVPLTSEQADEGERLYREGLARWHATPRDKPGAMGKWREASALHHYLGLCALSAALSEMGTAPSATSASDQWAQLDAEAFAIAEYRLGFVEAAKLHLHPDRPDARKGDQQAQALLNLAASLGDQHAMHMLKAMARMAG